MRFEYPLSWPPEYVRTTYPKDSRFKATFASARDHLIKEVRLFGGVNAVLSTNVPLSPRGALEGGGRPLDPGVVVRFERDGLPYCFPCDRWSLVQDNVHALALYIEAERGKLRWVNSDMVERSIAGFLSGGKVSEPWWQVLRVSEETPLEICEAAYKALARKAHPDAGGTEAEMARLNQAIQERRNQEQ